MYDKKLGKVVEVSEPVFVAEGITIIPDEKEFVSFNAFDKPVKWTGRRSKKAVMKQYNCVDYRDTVGVEKSKMKRIAVLREQYRKDRNVSVQTQAVNPQEVKQRREQRRRTHFTGYRLTG